MKTVIAFVGFKGSGKNTAADALFDHGFTVISFADALKDMLAAIFCWDRQLLEGQTLESRAWREQIDEWWADRLEIPHFTPRWAMTHLGTDVLRRHFNDLLWVHNVERRISMIDTPIVLPDARFPNEVALVRKFQGRVYRIIRGPDPWWVPNAIQAIHGSAMDRDMMDCLETVHESEWAWLGEAVDQTITNDGSIEHLRKQVAETVLWSYDNT
jgi:hypothetical protein